MIMIEIIKYLLMLLVVQALSNPVPTGSHYQRYIFKSQQNYFRPQESEKDVFNIKILVITPQHQLILKY